MASCMNILKKGQNAYTLSFRKFNWEFLSKDLISPTEAKVKRTREMGKGEMGKGVIGLSLTQKYWSTRLQPFNWQMVKQRLS